MTRNATNQVTTTGIDIGKNSFHLIGLDAPGTSCCAANCPVTR